MKFPKFNSKFIFKNLSFWRFLKSTDDLHNTVREEKDTEQPLQR